MYIKHINLPKEGNEHKMPRGRHGRTELWELIHLLHSRLSDVKWQTGTKGTPWTKYAHLRVWCPRVHRVEGENFLQKLYSGTWTCMCTNGYAHMGRGEDTFFPWIKTVYLLITDGSTSEESSQPPNKMGGTWSMCWFKWLASIIDRLPLGTHQITQVIIRKESHTKE